MNHPPEVREHALELLRNPEMSYPQIRDATGVPVGTLGHWAKKAGISGRSTVKTEAATDARRKRLEAKRTKLADDLLRYAHDIARRAHSVALDNEEIVNGKGEKTGIFFARARDAKDLMTAAAIALDKFRLEMGEPTTVNETRNEVGAAEAAKQRVDELAERRHSKSA